MSAPTRGVNPPATVLLDLDGVVAKQLPLTCEYLAEEHGIHLTPEEVTDWSYPIPELDGHIGHVITDLMHERPAWYFGEMPAVDGVHEGVAALREGGYRVEIATHRIPETHDHSKAWLADQGIEYDTFHEEVPRDKGALDGDVLIDDYHGNVADAIAAGKRGVLMRQPYSDPAACTGAHVADSWDGVRTFFGV